MRISIYALLSLVLVSCVKVEVPQDANKAALTEKLTTTQEYTVPVKSGYVTEVYIDGTVVATAVTPMTILIPKTSAKTRAVGDVTLNYIPTDEYPNELENSSLLFQVICFEDSRNGDYDYNDLIIHVCYTTKGNCFGFGVQPIALGSTKSFKLGYALYQGNKLISKDILTPAGADCRKQYFKGKEGFLNTEGTEGNFFPDNNKVAGWHQYLASTIRFWDMKKINGSGAMRVEWFIQLTDGSELYALSTQYLNASFDKQQLPYGIVISGTGVSYVEGNKGEVGKDWFNYPQEKVSIENVYPEMWNWLTSDASYDFSDIYDKTVKEGAYPAVDLGIFTCNSLSYKDQYLQN